MINISNYKRNEEHKQNTDSGIYKIVNIKNGKVYVGQTYDLTYRWLRHRSDLNTNSHYNKHLQNAWNKYGQENFRFEILERCPLDIIDEREIYWINKLDSINNGYNLCEGGLGCRGYKHTEEEILKMRMIQNPKAVVRLDLNGNLLDEWISASHCAKTLNLSDVRSIKSCCNKTDHVKSSKGYIYMWKEDYDKNGFDKEYYSTRKKFSKHVAQYTIDGVFIKEWNSIQEIVNQLRYSRESIRKCCVGEFKQSHGYLWKFI